MGAEDPPTVQEDPGRRRTVISDWDVGMQVGPMSSQHRAVTLVPRATFRDGRVLYRPVDPTGTKHKGEANGGRGECLAAQVGRRGFNNLYEWIVQEEPELLA